VSSQAAVVVDEADRRLDDLVERRLRALSRDLVSECDAAGELLAICRATVEAGRNVPAGFWCSQNEPEAAEHALTVQHALSGLRGEVLATDAASVVLSARAVKIHDDATLVCSSLGLIESDETPISAVHL
jgi:hypothetical protein